MRVGGAQRDNCTDLLCVCRQHYGQGRTAVIAALVLVVRRGKHAGQYIICTDQLAYCVNQVCAHTGLNSDFT